MIRTDDTSKYEEKRVQTFDRYGTSTGDNTVDVRGKRDVFSISSDGMTANFKDPSRYTYKKVTTKMVNGFIRTWTDPKWWPSYMSSSITGNLGETPGKGPLPDDSFKDNVARKAVMDFYGQVKQSNLNLAQDLAEYNETTKLVRKMLLFKKDVKKNFKKLVLDTKKDPADVASGAWLSYTYGVKPTMQTLHGLANFESRKLGSYGNLFRVRGRSQAKDRLVTKVGNKTYTSKSSYRVEVGALLTVPPADDLLRLTSLDPKVLAYELAPYSFVLDWIVDIGGYLEALETRRRYLSQLTGNYSSSTTQTFQYYKEAVLFVPPPRGGSSFEKALSGWTKTTNMTRGVSDAPPEVYYPRLEVPRLGYKRIASGLSLLYQGTKRYRRDILKNN